MFEGIDRAGKSTQCSRLIQALEARGHRVRGLHFPVYDTEAGEILRRHVSGKAPLTPPTAHLMFAANRWEMVDEMRGMLDAGVTLVVDRYSFSGIAYSLAQGLRPGFCRGTEEGLPRPDIVFHLRMDPEIAATRAGYGQDLFDDIEFQKRVQAALDTHLTPNPLCRTLEVVGRDVDDIHESVMCEALSLFVGEGG